MKNNYFKMKNSQIKSRTFKTIQNDIKPPKKSIQRWIYGKGKTES